MRFAHDDDTIVAPITPPGRSGVGTVRISGEKALSIIEGLSQRDRESFKPWRAVLSKIFDPERGLLIDSAIVTYYRSPKSYTGEDVVEISSHGNPIILSAICDGAIFLGARVAEAGEFTKRAFLKGKMDLSQAEAVQELIAASTMLSAAAARKRLEGGLKDAVTRTRERLLESLMHLEAAVDFPEEELEILSKGKIGELLSEALGGVDELLSTYRAGRVLAEGAKIAIAGKPNVGKSSLLNCFLREERAIVSPRPGTTRDFISEMRHIRGIPLKFIDTAGIRSGGVNDVESEGVSRARKIIGDADLVLLVIDGSSALSEEDDAAREEISGKQFILVVNKKDLGIVEPGERFGATDGCCGSVSVSAKSREGVEELESRIYSAILGEEALTSVEVLVGNMRQKEMLEKAKGYIEDAIGGALEGLSPEFISLEVRDAASALGEIVGDITTEDILEKIFSSFCIGK
jgi:tRNA modification GTPase